MRARQQTGMIVDWQIESLAESLAHEWVALVAPAKEPLTAQTEQALSRFEGAGGVLVRLNASDHWETNSSRAALSELLLLELAHRTGTAPIAVKGAQGAKLHVIAHRDTAPAVANSPDTTIVYISNDFAQLHWWQPVAHSTRARSFGGSPSTPAEQSTNCEKCYQRTRKWREDRLRTVPN